MAAGLFIAGSRRAGGLTDIMGQTPTDRRSQIRRLGSGTLALAATIGVLAAALQPFESTKPAAGPCFIVSGSLVVIGLALLVAWYFWPEDEKAAPFSSRLM